jgi:hypothetical protein
MVVWSVIIMLAILLIIVTWYIYYILKMAYAEMNDGQDDPTKSEELLQLPSDRSNESS